MMRFLLLRKCRSTWNDLERRPPLGEGSRTRGSGFPPAHCATLPAPSGRGRRGVTPSPSRDRASFRSEEGQSLITVERASVGRGGAEWSGRPPRRAGRLPRPARGRRGAGPGPTGGGRGGRSGPASTSGGSAADVVSRASGTTSYITRNRTFSRYDRGARVPPPPGARRVPRRISQLRRSRARSPSPAHPWRGSSSPSPLRGPVGWPSSSCAGPSPPPSPPASPERGGEEGKGPRRGPGRGGGDDR